MPRRTRKLPRSFFDRDAETVAEALIGKVLVRRIDAGEYRARIVETEAYVGTHDAACHASRGRTPRTSIMFGPPGYAYVYFVYGMHDMLNIVCSHEDDAQAVLVRAAEPLSGFEGPINLSGPGRLARGMRITARRDNGVDLVGDRIFLLDDGEPPRRIVRSPRIGVDYAGAWKDAPLRFADAVSKAVSRPINPSGIRR